MSSAINNESGQGAGAPRASILRQLCAVRPIDPADSSGKSRLKQVLSARALIAIGLGATLGSGIFVLNGTGALINVPAVLIIAAMTALLYVGVRGSASANTIMVTLKVAIIVIIVIAGLKYVDPANWHPYVPPNTGVRGHFGWTGVMQGAAIIFFSYVGFDTASTTALEARNPQRDLPLGIIGALVISAVLYVAMATVLTGMVPFQKLDSDAPVAVALDAHPQHRNQV